MYAGKKTKHGHANDTSQRKLLKKRNKDASLAQLQLACASGQAPKKRLNRSQRRRLQQERLKAARKQPLQHHDHRTKGTSSLSWFKVFIALGAIILLFTGITTAARIPRDERDGIDFDDTLPPSSNNKPHSFPAHNQTAVCNNPHPLALTNKAMSASIRMEAPIVDRAQPTFATHTSPQRITKGLAKKKKKKAVATKHQGQPAEESVIRTNRKVTILKEFISQEGPIDDQQLMSLIRVKLIDYATPGQNQAVIAAAETGDTAAMLDIADHFLHVNYLPESISKRLALHAGARGNAEALQRLSFLLLEKHLEEKDIINIEMTAATIFSIAVETSDCTTLVKLANRCHDYSRNKLSDIAFIAYQQSVILRLNQGVFSREQLLLLSRDNRYVRNNQSLYEVYLKTVTRLNMEKDLTTPECTGFVGDLLVRMEEHTFYTLSELLLKSLAGIAAISPDNLTDFERLFFARTVHSYPLDPVLEFELVNDLQLHPELNQLAGGAVRQALQCEVSAISEIARAYSRMGNKLKARRWHAEAAVRGSTADLAMYFLEEGILATDEQHSTPTYNYAYAMPMLTKLQKNFISPQLDFVLALQYSEKDPAYALGLLESVLTSNASELKPKAFKLIQVCKEHVQEQANNRVIALEQNGYLTDTHPSVQQWHMFMRWQASSEERYWSDVQLLFPDNTNLETYFQHLTVWYGSENLMGAEFYNSATQRNILNNMRSLLVRPVSQAERITEQERDKLAEYLWQNLPGLTLQVGEQGKDLTIPYIEASKARQVFLETYGFNYFVLNKERSNYPTLSISAREDVTLTVRMVREFVPQLIMRLFHVNPALSLYSLLDILAIRTNKPVELALRARLLDDINGNTHLLSPMLIGKSKELQAAAALWHKALKQHYIKAINGNIDAIRAVAQLYRKAQLYSIANMWDCEGLVRGDVTSLGHFLQFEFADHQSHKSTKTEDKRQLRLLENAVHKLHVVSSNPQITIARTMLTTEEDTEGSIALLEPLIAGHDKARHIMAALLTSRKTVAAHEKALTLLEEVSDTALKLNAKTYAVDVSEELAKLRKSEDPSVTDWVKVGLEYTLWFLGILLLVFLVIKCVDMFRKAIGQSIETVNTLLNNRKFLVDSDLLPDFANKYVSKYNSFFYSTNDNLSDSVYAQSKSGLAFSYTQRQWLIAVSKYFKFKLVEGEADISIEIDGGFSRPDKSLDEIKVEILERIYKASPEYQAELAAKKREESKQSHEQECNTIVELFNNLSIRLFSLALFSSGEYNEAAFILTGPLLLFQNDTLQLITDKGMSFQVNAFTYLTAIVKELKGEIFLSQKDHRLIIELPKSSDLSKLLFARSLSTVTKQLYEDSFEKHLIDLEKSEAEKESERLAKEKKRRQAEEKRAEREAEEQARRDAIAAAKEARRKALEKTKKKKKAAPIAGDKSVAGRKPEIDPAQSQAALLARAGASLRGGHPTQRPKYQAASRLMTLDEWRGVGNEEQVAHPQAKAKEVKINIDFSQELGRLTGECNVLIGFLAKKESKAEQNIADLTMCLKALLAVIARYFEAFAHQTGSKQANRIRNYCMHRGLTVTDYRWISTIAEMIVATANNGGKISLDRAERICTQSSSDYNPVADLKSEIEFITDKVSTLFTSKYNIKEDELGSALKGGKALPHIDHALLWSILGSAMLLREHVFRMTNDKLPERYNTNGLSKSSLQFKAWFLTCLEIRREFAHQDAEYFPDLDQLIRFAYLTRENEASILAEVSCLHNTNLRLGKLTL